MNILGISCYYHNSAACIVQNGNVLSAIEEERFSRLKFDDDFPYKSIDYCLETAGITPSELDYVAFYDKNVLKFERLLDNYIAVAPRGLKSFLDVMPKWLHKRLWVKDEIKKLGISGKKILFPEHHLSHAAYSFFSSDFHEAAILTADGVGEWSTTSLGVGKEEKIELTHDIRWPHSLGMLYSAFTYFLGFHVNEGEYKVMGMASYGKPKYYDLIVNKLIDLKPDGSFNLNMKYFAYTYDKVMTNKNFEFLFGIPVRTNDSKIEQIHYDIAASIQFLLEEILLKMVNFLYEQTNSENLCLGGGVALNGKANYRILTEGPFKEVFVPPSPGDAGSAIGCALYVYYSHLKSKRSISKNTEQHHLNLVYLGTQFSKSEILDELNSDTFNYKEYPTSELLKKTANLLSEKNVIGWYQNKMEWGPRALGNRSILADPRENDMKDILNMKIKHRESFRPFAPSVLEEYTNDFFDLNILSPWMAFVVPVKNPNIIPAVTHVDNTARVQTVSRKFNSLYYDLINEFFKLTNIPVLVNTSMNVMGEPIVNTPKQAIMMLKKTEMDYLVMGNFLINKV